MPNKRTKSKKRKKGTKKSSSKPQLLKTVKTIFFILTSLVFITLLVDLFLQYNHYNSVVAYINNQPVRRKTFNQILLNSYGQEVFNQLIIETLVKQEADKQAISISDEEVEHGLEQLALPYEQTVEQFLAQQEELGYDKEIIRSSVELDLILSKIVSPQVPTQYDEETLKAYYYTNQDSLGTKDNPKPKFEDVKATIEKRLYLENIEQAKVFWVNQAKNQASIQEWLYTKPGYEIFRGFRLLWRPN